MTLLKIENGAYYLATRLTMTNSIANVITDYIDLARELEYLAESKGASAAEIKYILNKYGHSKNTEGKPRLYGELLEGRFRLSRVIRIDHKDDGNDVANKIFDYSGKTIEKLMKYGYRDTLVHPCNANTNFWVFSAVF